MTAAFVQKQARVNTHTGRLVLVLSKSECEVKSLSQSVRMR